MKIPKTMRQKWVYMSFWTKKVGGIGFRVQRGQIGNSQGAEKVANKSLLSSPETMGHRGSQFTGFCLDPFYLMLR